MGIVQTIRDRNGDRVTRVVLDGGHVVDFTYLVPNQREALDIAVHAAQHDGAESLGLDAA